MPSIVLLAVSWERRGRGTSKPQKDGPFRFPRDNGRSMVLLGTLFAESIDGL